MRILPTATHPAVLHRLCTMGSVAALCWIALDPPPLPAQRATPPGSISAVVRDTTGAGIAGAELTVAGTNIRGYTDDDGHLQLGPVAPGPARLTIRRLGFRPTSVDLTVDASRATVETVRLVEIAHRLDVITVRGTIHAYGSRMLGFYERRSQGFGHFFTRSQIQDINPSHLTDLFRRIPGMALASTNVIQNAVRMRGARDCPPLLWLDGSPAAAAEYDLDTIDPESVEAMEVYSGPSEVPVQFQPPMDVQACGAIVIWTRQGEPRHAYAKAPADPDEIAKLIDSSKVYTSDQVDTPAHQDTSVHVQPFYPEALFMSGTSGKVVAEFVVDTTGSVVMGTFSAISSTDPDFTISVRRALEHAAYVPAVLKGRKVQQVVEQPFTFVGDTAAARTARKG